MQVQYENTFEDIVQFQVYFNEHSELGRRAKLIALIAGLATFVVAGIVMWFVTKSPLPLVLFGLVIVGWIAWYPSRYRKTVQKNARRFVKEVWKQQFLTTLSIDEEGLHAASEGGDSNLKWSMIRSIDEDLAATYLFFGNGTAIVVPHRSFPSNLERVEFFDRARAHWSKAQLEG